MPETSRTMQWVILALVPGYAAMAIWFGVEVLLNAALAVALALATEAICLSLRRHTVTNALTDGSATVTALLIAAAIPPAAPVYVLVVAVVSGIALGKHAFGGLGQNPFNPAMVGYALALVSLPAAFALWPLDGTTSATALDTLKHNAGLTLAELRQNPVFGAYGGRGWEWVNLAFAAGGILLLARKIIGWRLPVIYLATIGVLSGLTYDSGSSASLGSPLMHWTMGGTMLAAFFVLTDPVTHPNGPRAQFLFALIAGTTTFAIRAWGAYPDGIAFGVLLANAATPYLDRRFA